MKHFAAVDLSLLSSSNRYDLLAALQVTWARSIIATAYTVPAVQFHYMKLNDHELFFFFSPFFSEYI